MQTLDSLYSTLISWIQLTIAGFLAPGEFLLREAALRAPGALAALDVGAADSTAVLCLAVAYWLVVLLVAARILRIVRLVMRKISTFLRIVYFWIALFARSIKTLFVCTLRKLSLWRRPGNLDETRFVEISETELAFLRHAAERGPGFAVSAPDLAESFAMRPAQAQRYLDSLAANRLVDYAFGATDGFENYRLTDTGAAFLAMWNRRQKRSIPAPRQQPA